MLGESQKCVSLYNRFGCTKDSRLFSGRFWVRSARDDRLPKGDPRDGDFYAVDAQLKADGVAWGDLLSLKHEALTRLHKLAYGTAASSAKKGDIVTRLEALHRHSLEKEAAAKAEGITPCHKYFPAFKRTTAGVAKGMCPCGVVVFSAVNLDAESPQVGRSEQTYLLL